MKSHSSSQDNASLIPVKQSFAFLTSSPGVSHGQRFHFYDEVCESRLEGKFMGGNKGIRHQTHKNLDSFMDEFFCLLVANPFSVEVRHE